MHGEGARHGVNPIVKGIGRLSRRAKALWKIRHHRMALQRRLALRLVPAIHTVGQKHRDRRQPLDFRFCEEIALKEGDPRSPQGLEFPFRLDPLGDHRNVQGPGRGGNARDDHLPRVRAIDASDQILIRSSCKFGKRLSPAYPAPKSSSAVRNPKR